MLLFQKNKIYIVYKINKSMNYLKDYFKQDDKSAFNSTFACFERIHWLLIDCSDHSRLALNEGCNPYYLNMWKTTILALHREIMPNLSQEDYKKENTQFEKYEQKLIKLGSPIRKIKTESGEVIKVIDKKIFLQLWNIINSMELFLRIKATEKGMLIKKRDTGW